jgi:hypothetical protein
MSEASQLTIGQKIMYTQLPKEPTDVVGEVLNVFPTHIELKHSEKGKNSIPITLPYTVVNPTTKLTPVPTIINVTHDGTTYTLNSIVSYRLKNNMEVIGEIVKIFYEKGKYKLLIKHKNKEQLISIEQPGLQLKHEVDTTEFPVIKLVDIPFHVGETVSYSIAGMTGLAIGEIHAIIIDETGVTFQIMHNNNKIKSMQYMKGDDVVGSFTIIDDPSISPTDEPIKPNSLGDYKKGDIVSFTSKLGRKKGKIIDFIWKYNQILVEVDDTKENFKIPIDREDLKKENTGSKKYMLEDVNKYRLKYAKYKAKYLLLK